MQSLDCEGWKTIQGGEKSKVQDPFADRKAPITSHFYCNFRLFPSAVQNCGSAKLTKVLYLKTVPNCWRFYDAKIKPGDTYRNDQPCILTFNNSNMNTTFTIFSIQGTWEITECCVRSLAKIPAGVAHSDFRRKRKINSIRRKTKQIRLKSLSSLSEWSKNWIGPWLQCINV